MANRSQEGPTIGAVAPAVMPNNPQVFVPQIHVIRKCQSLLGPAIFLSWEDCSFIIGQDLITGNVDFRSFDAMDQAVQYIRESPYHVRPYRTQLLREPSVVNGEEVPTNGTQTAAGTTRGRKRPPHERTSTEGSRSTKKTKGPSDEDETVIAPSTEDQQQRNIADLVEEEEPPPLPDDISEGDNMNTNSIDNDMSSSSSSSAQQTLLRQQKRDANRKQKFDAEFETNFQLLEEWLHNRLLHK